MTEQEYLFALQRRHQRMPAVDARVLEAASEDFIGSARVVARATALAELRERQARWMFAAGNRVWQASIDAGQRDDRALDMCQLSGQLRRQAEVLRTVLDGWFVT